MSEHIETCEKCINHRHITSQMIVSHVPIIIPCIWWILGSNEGSHTDHCVDKIMAVVLTISVLVSSIYHYYYECVLHSIEAMVLIINTIMLNAYMYYRGVQIIYIAGGIGILYILQRTIDSVDVNARDIYEVYHPLCHYIAGAYVTYCVYLIQETFGDDNMAACPGQLLPVNK